MKRGAIVTNHKHLALQEGPVQQVKRVVSENTHKHEQLCINDLHTTIKHRATCTSTS